MLQGSRTIGRLLKLRVNKTPDKYALGWIENNEVKNLTFKDYFSTIELLSNAFHKIGVQVADKVSIISQTCKEWHFLDLATMCSRCCLVPIYPNYLASEIEFIINHSESSYIILENDQQCEKIISVLENLQGIKAIISIQDLNPELITKIKLKCSYYSFKDLLWTGKDELEKNQDYFEQLISSSKPEELASIIYTSGTTGEPKGAVITQHAMTSMLINVEGHIKSSFSSSDKTLVFLPLAHVLGRCDSLLPLVFGWQAVYAESLDKILDNLTLVRPTIMVAVPRIFEKIYRKILDQVDASNPMEKQIFKWATKIAENYYAKIDKDLSPTTLEMIEFQAAYRIVFHKIYQRFGGKIRFFVSGGAPLSTEIIKFLRFANLTILEGYGLTETIAPCCINPLSRQVPGTVGRPMGDVEFRFDTDGEILIKTQALFKEYFKNSNATAAAFDKGWFRSGDIGEFTAEGYLKITDRKKDIIITSGGKNVAPQKIENLAKSLPHISYLVVIGDNRNYLTALVGIEKERFLSLLDELNLPKDCHLQDISRHPTVQKIIGEEIDELNKNLAQFETIKKFFILDQELTTENFLTPSLKIKRKSVIQHFQKEIDEMYES